MLPILPLKTNSILSLHIFSSPPPIPSPRISNPHISLPPPIPIPSPPPLPSKKNQRPIPRHNETTATSPKAKGKHIFKHNGHCTTKLGEGRGVSKGEDEDGMSYKVEGAPFEFKFSYTESPKVKPLALREPPLTPFGPRPVNRPWFGRASLAKAKKMLPLLNPPPKDMPLFVPDAISFSRQKILGKPLTEDEINELVDKAVQSTRKVNLGRDGLTHNMLELIHTHWRRQPVCKIRCKGVPTVDMDNVCHHLEEKTGGQIIHRIGGVVYLFRGRNYSSKYRPKFPLMLWKPANPVYPKLIEQAPDGLTVEEADAMRRKGRHLPAICKLGKNGVYLDLVRNVREAFDKTELVRINCRGMKPSDYKRIGVKLKELVPCVLLSFDKENILMWRGKEYKVINSEGCATISSTYGSEYLGDESSNSRITGIQSTDGIICGELEEAATSLNTELVKQRSVASSSYSSFNDRRVASQFKESLELRLKKFPNSLQSKELISVVNNDNIFDERSNYQLHKQNDSDASEDENGLEVKDSTELVHASDAEGKSNATTFAINSSKTSSEAVPLPTTTGVIDTKFMGTIENNSYDLLSKLDCKKHYMQGGDYVYEAKDTNEKGILTEEEANECSAKAEHVECLWPQAIESRIVLLLDGPCLDPDAVSEIPDKFAKKASQGSHVKSNRILSARKSGRGEKRAIRDEESSQSGGKVTFQDVNKESEEITHSSDMVPPGLLLLDDLAQLLLAP